MSEKVFSKWMDRPEGEGVYHFVGKRYTPNRTIVDTNDLVEVRAVVVAQQFSYAACFFGRMQKFSVDRFHGKWRKLLIEFQGERTR